MPSFSRRCAVTGATGYVGSRILEYFETNGWSTCELTRRPAPGGNQKRIHVPFQLELPVDSSVFRDNGIRVLIHCAYDFRPVKWRDIERVNVEGSARLLRAARAGGVDTIVVLSSISAFDGCSSLYGKAKLAIEKVAFEIGAFVIRPGLVHGERSSGGMFGSLQRIAEKASVIPLIGGGRYVQYLVHEHDLSELLLRIANGGLKATPEPIVAAARGAWQMRDLLCALSTKPGSRPRFIPLPWPAIWLGLKTAEKLGIAVPFRSDSVISLVRQNPRPDFSEASRIGITFREFASDPVRRSFSSSRR
jgi:nucleoside-diphosphate-sugar epimerase